MQKTLHPWVWPKLWLFRPGIRIYPTFGEAWRRPPDAAILRGKQDGFWALQTCERSIRLTANFPPINNIPCNGMCIFTWAIPAPMSPPPMTTNSLILSLRATDVEKDRPWAPLAALDTSPVKSELLIFTTLQHDKKVKCAIKHALKHSATNSKCSQHSHILKLQSLHSCIFHV